MSYVSILTSKSGSGGLEYNTLFGHRHCNCGWLKWIDGHLISEVDMVAVDASILSNSRPLGQLQPRFQGFNLLDGV